MGKKRAPEIARIGIEPFSDKEKSVKVQWFVFPSQEAAIRELAAKKGRSVSRQVRLLVNEALKIKDPASGH